MEIVATRRAEDEVICYFGFGLVHDCSSCVFVVLLLLLNSFSVANITTSRRSCSTGRALSSSAIRFTILILVNILFGNFDHQEDLVRQF